MATSIISSLKLTTARKPRALPDVIKRRNKFLLKLNEQRELAQAQLEGRMYTPKRLRTLRDAATGERTVREMPIRIKAWWWTGEKNETLLSIFYGSKTLELAKGKTAIEITDSKQLVSVLDTVITATQNAELDVLIEAASVKLRDGFKK
jgi:hypothetical protein